MNPKVLSIFNNAKIFLSADEMKELAICIDKDFEKPKTKPKKPNKNDLGDEWTLENVTERLLATYFNKNKRKKII